MQFVARRLLDQLNRIPQPVRELRDDQQPQATQDKGVEYRFALIDFSIKEI